MTIKELFALLSTASSVEEIDCKREEIAELLPQVKCMFDFDQEHEAHQYDLWFHSVHTVVNLRKGINDDMLYLAALLHDIGKPDCKVWEKGAVHFYRHPERSMEIVRDEVLPSLLERGYSFSEQEKKRLLYYVEYHDEKVSQPEHLQKHLQVASFAEFQKLMQLQAADAKAHVLLPRIEKKIEICEQLAGEHGVLLYESMLKSE